MKSNLNQDKFKLTWADYYIAPALAGILAVWLFLHIGTAINWDDLLYMNLSQYTTSQAWVLNRYGHIYLQKIFFGIMGDAISGGKAFWCFLFSGTCVLTYWCAQVLVGKRGRVIGIIAVLFVCIQHVFGKNPGCSLPDFTVMFLAILGTFVYLAFINHRNKHTYFFIMLLGVIFFWVVKSKETGICLGILFFGLGRDDTGESNINRFVKDMGWVLFGILTGCVLLMVLDLVFIGDALFSIRPSSIKEVLSYNLEPPYGIRADRVTQSWYSLSTTRPLFVPLLLYLLIGWKSPIKSFSKHEKIVWLFPLLLLVFLTFSQENKYVIPRYFIPAIPILSIWAAQFFGFDIGRIPPPVGKCRHISQSLLISILVLAAFILVYIFVTRIPDLVEYYKLNTSIAGFPHLKYDRLDGSQLFYMLMIIPSAFTVLLAVGVISSKRGLMALFFSSLCFFLLICPPLAHNVDLLRQKVVAQKSKWRFEPYRVFEDELEFSKNAKIFVSKEIHKRSWMLGRGQESHCWMFNIFFNKKYDYDQFIDGGWSDIIKGEYTYAFLTDRDWKGISKKHKMEPLLKKYELKTNRNAVYNTRSGQMQLMLLKKRSGII